jgi:hypothetical protein
VRLIRLFGRIQCLAACGLGLALLVVMLASLARTSEIAHAETHAKTRHEHDNPLPARSARAPVPDATSPDPGGRRMTGLAQLGNNDDPQEPAASALRAYLGAVSAAANRRAAGANTPPVEATGGSPGTQRDRGDSGGAFEPYLGAAVPTGRSTVSTPAGLSGGGGDAADAGRWLATAAILSTVLVAVLGRSRPLWAEVHRRTTLPRSIERRARLPGFECHPRRSGGDPAAGRGDPPGRRRQATITARARPTCTRARCPTPTSRPSGGRAGSR